MEYTKWLKKLQEQAREKNIAFREHATMLCEECSEEQEIFCYGKE